MRTNEPQGTSAGRLIFIGITSGSLCGGERSTERVQIIDSSARSRRLEVEGVSRERARARETRERSLAPVLFCPHYFQASVTQAN